MTSEYDKLQNEFDEKVIKLQKTCKHKHLTSWADEWWALGHPTGYRIKSCLNCHSLVKREKLKEANKK